jgi:hypothetical protein
MNNHHFHAIVWIDHHEARVFHFSPTDVERLVLHPDHPTRHIHHKANSIGSGHAAEDHAFLQAVAQSIADAGAVLITGPANAKTELIKHISQHDPKLMKAIVGVETVDHPSDGQLVAYARHYFNAEDHAAAEAKQRQHPLRSLGSALFRRSTNRGALMLRSNSAAARAADLSGTTSNVSSRGPATIGDLSGRDRARFRSGS